VQGNSLTPQKVCQCLFAALLKKAVLHHRNRFLTDLGLKVNIFFHFFSLFSILDGLTRQKQQVLGHVLAKDLTL
jgi:hypothetical protein